MRARGDHHWNASEDAIAGISFTDGDQCAGGTNVIRGDDLVGACHKN